MVSTKTLNPLEIAQAKAVWHNKVSRRRGLFDHLCIAKASQCARALSTKTCLPNEWRSLVVLDTADTLDVVPGGRLVTEEALIHLGVRLARERSRHH